MPETKTRSDSLVPQILYGLYQFAVPLGVAIGIVIATTLVVKQQDKYQAITEDFSHFDIAIFAAVPICSYLVSETLFGSGLQTLIYCGIL